MSRKMGRMIAVAGWVCLVGGGLLGCGSSAGGDLSILNIEPRGGATAGEQPVRITGSNFRQDIGYTVYFGATRAQQVTIMDDTTLLVATPQHDSGAVDVVVAADDGPAFRIVNGFEFTDQGGGTLEHVGTSTGQGEERF